MSRLARNNELRDRTLHGRFRSVRTEDVIADCGETLYRSVRGRAQHGSAEESVSFARTLLAQRPQDFDECGLPEPGQRMELTCYALCERGSLLGIGLHRRQGCIKALHCRQRGFRSATCQGAVSKVGVTPCRGGRQVREGLQPGFLVQVELGPRSDGIGRLKQANAEVSVVATRSPTRPRERIDDLWPPRHRPQPTRHLVGHFNGTRLLVRAVAGSPAGFSALPGSGRQPHENGRNEHPKTLRGRLKKVRNRSILTADIIRIVKRHGCIWDADSPPHGRDLASEAMAARASGAWH